jgi:hypothetical protein
MAEKAKHDWAKIVAESNNGSVFLPDGFKKAQDDLEKTRSAYNADATAMAKREILMNIATQNLFVEIRKYLEKNGHPDIWVKDIGFDANALKEGAYVLNIRENGAQ